MYNPKPPPYFNNPDFERAFQYIYDELRGVSGAFETLEAEKVKFVERHSAPDKPRLGDVYLADGTNWNPLSTTQNNPYFVYHDGTNYNALSDPPDYGTFTPRIDGDSAAGSGTYTAQVGHYTKIGRQVTITIGLGWSAHTGTGGMLLAGLPFTVGSTKFGSFPTMIQNIDWPGTANGQINGYFNPGAATCYFYHSTDNAAWSAVQMDTSGNMNITATYFTA